MTARHMKQVIAHAAMTAALPECLNHAVRVMPAHLAMSVTCTMFGTHVNHPVGS